MPRVFAEFAPTTFEPGPSPLLPDRLPRDGRGLPLGGGRELPPEGQTEKIELLSAALDLPVALAYGRHIAGGNVVFEQENPDGTVTLLLALGEGEWDGPERVWVNGLELDLADTTLFHFHPGLEGENGRETNPTARNQKICSFFPANFVPQLTFSRTAYAAFRLRRDPTSPGPEFDIRGIYRTARVRQFDTAGNQTAYAYSANPAWIALDLLLRRVLFPHGKPGEALPQSVKDRVDFQAFRNWADFCDTDLTINAQVVNRFECHVAFVDPTDLLRALEWVHFQGRAYLLERSGKLAPFADQPRGPLLAVEPGDLAADSLQFGRRSLRAAANHYLFRFRALDSGVACNDPRADFQPQLKEAADEDHQDQVGRVITAEVDLGNSTPERAERLAEYLKRRTLDLSATLALRLLPDTPGALDLLPGDLLEAPADLAYTGTRPYEILEISDEPDGSRQLFALEYSDSIFVETAGPQQQVVECPEAGGGFAPNATRLQNVLQNASFFRGGVAGQEGADRPRYWKEYSNAGGAPAVPGEFEHLLADDRVRLKTKTATTNKIGIRTLWKNLGRLFKPGQFVTVAVSLRHTGASGVYDKDVKLKLDSAAEDYLRPDGSKFDATIPAATLRTSFVIRHVIFELRPDQPVPDTLNVFLWSEATAAAPANEDLEVDFVTLTTGRLWQPYDPMAEIRDADVTWDGTAGLYSLPAHLTKEAAPAADSGGAGVSSGGLGSGGSDFGEGFLLPFQQS